MSYRPDAAQQAVIASEAPVLVVLGGAGTGKTTTAAAAAAEHLRRRDEQQCQQRLQSMRGGRRAPDQATARALFLSFSRTAVTQMLDRSATVVGSLLNRVEMSTFHGFAWRVLNDFGAHYGHPKPLTVMSSAEEKIPGSVQGMVYGQLLPAATKMLQRAVVAEHYSRRYGLIICDEFQDTSDEEWDFLKLLAPRARRIFLGDVNQCIYAGFKKIDPVRRIALAEALPGTIRVDLTAASHRDPSGVLPAAAEAARARRFNDEAIRVAIVSRRLQIVRPSPNSAAGVMDVERIVRDARSAGHSVSVFTHTNDAATALSDALTVAGVVHEQVGFSEAYAEALKAQLALVRRTFGQDVNWRRALAVYVAATNRSRNGQAPPLAQHILYATNPAFERAIKVVAGELRRAAVAASGREIAHIVSGAWRRLGTIRGQETWTQAARHTSAVLKPLVDADGLRVAVAQLDQAHDTSLLGILPSRARPVQVMNLHQTKGREADITVLLLQPNEYHGNESEPYTQGSRLLYVTLTRARKRTYIIVPTRPHGLWQPLIMSCIQNGGHKV